MECLKERQIIRYWKTLNFQTKLIAVVAVLVYQTSLIIFLKAFCSNSYVSILFWTGAVSLTFHGIGKEVGTAITGYLFTAVGTKIALCAYSLLTVVIFVIFSIYMFTAKDLIRYTRLQENEEDEAEMNLVEEVWFGFHLIVSAHVISKLRFTHNIN